MREIKYRQLVGKEFHYFGIINGEFIGPCNINTYPIIEQYTGLKDSDGVEVYEGDVLQTDYYVCDRKELQYKRCTVEWDGLGFYMGDFKDWMQIKVVGNIHEGGK